MGRHFVAQAIHERSRRHGGPFVSFNLAAVDASTLEAELFGRDGAAAQPGLIARAEGGTLVLEEIGALPPPLQAKLLRLLDHGVVRCVGATADVRVDARIIATTDRDLREAVGARRFAEDLYYRLSELEIAIVRSGESSPRNDARPPAEAEPLEPLEAVERRHVLRVLEAVDNNKTLAARILRVGRKTLYRMLERWRKSSGATTKEPSRER